MCLLRLLVNAYCGIGRKDQFEENQVSPVIVWRMRPDEAYHVQRQQLQWYVTASKIAERANIVRQDEFRYAYMVTFSEKSHSCHLEHNSHGKIVLATDSDSD